MILRRDYKKFVAAHARDFVPIETPGNEISPFDRSKVYCASEKAGVVCVLENGNRVVYSKKVERDLRGRFRVHRDRLVFEVSPREIDREKRAAAKRETEWGTGKQFPGMLRA